MFVAAPGANGVSKIDYIGVEPFQDRTLVKRNAGEQVGAGIGVTDETGGTGRIACGGAAHERRGHGSRYQC